MRFNRGTSRFQQSFLSVDDQISSNHPIRFMDEVCESYVSENHKLEFDKGNKSTGRKAYHPSDLLKILVYGYFNGLSSSRKLERECSRNIELQWLTSGLIPDHKTISDFRKDNPAMIEGLFGYLLSLFKKQGLVTGKGIAVDGSKIKAYASRGVDLTSVVQKLENIEEQSTEYLQHLDALDQSEDELEVLQEKKVAMEKELELMASKKKRYQAYLAHFEEAQVTRFSPTDPEAKIMHGRYGKFWGYNVQSAVDTQNHIITHVQVTDHQNDKGLLSTVLEGTRQATGQQPEEVLADAGYYKQRELESLEGKGIPCYVGINWTAQQLKDKANQLIFTYLPKQDEYHCSEGKILSKWRRKTVDGSLATIYRGTQCGLCSKKEICTQSKQRTVQRNENQPWLDAFHAKMESQQGIEKLKKRKSVVEHPFGTIKYHMGQIPLLLRGTKPVQTEMNLYAIGYNLKRYFNMKVEKGRKVTPAQLAIAA